MNILGRTLVCTSLAVGVPLFYSSPASAAWCPIASDAGWKSVHSSTTAQLSAAFDANKNLLLAQMTLSHQRLMSALKVDTSQQNVDGQRVSTTIRKSDESLASVMTQSDVNRQITKAHADFGPDGQSVNACGSAEMIDEASSAISVYKQNAREFVTADKIYAGPGSTTTPTDAIAASLATHRSKFCSASEVKAGLCDRAGSEAGADVTVGTLFSDKASSQAKDAFMNNLVGLPLEKPTDAEAKTPRGSLMMANAMRAEAIRSPATVSVAAIRAMSDSAGGADSHDHSVNETMDELMSVYGGGAGYQAWYTELATKNERGLIQELNKLRALAIKLRSFRSESSSRVAATMAAILAAEADQM